MICKHETECNSRIYVGELGKGEWMCTRDLEERKVEFYKALASNPGLPALSTNAVAPAELAKGALKSWPSNEGEES